MVELQACGSLVNASALGAVEEEVKAESVAEISAQLQRERLKNAQLLERISFLESQIHQILDAQSCSSPSLPIGSCPNPLERNVKKFKRQKIENASNGIESENIIIKSTETASQKTMHDTDQLVSHKQPMPEDRLVNWMSMDETQFLQCEKAKDGDSAADCDDTDDSDDEVYDDYHEDDHGINNNHKEGEAANGSSTMVNELKHGVLSSSTAQSELAFSCANQEGNAQMPDTYRLCDGAELSNQQSKDVKSMSNDKALQGSLSLGNVTCKMGFGCSSQNKKPPKVAFCPKEVKRIVESEALREKNAQSHTIRKIIVFASLGIRHGCEDIYELDFSHFSILRKGEPYVSPTNPGEHVLYENPGVRRKVFYPNWQNPILCPVQIVEEEKAMRPSDASCPSCLFLCIKYGGRTRNLPQNEYVRQRMGRNKLKSFGPLMCRMAMLVHIRSGSFFFKALGITLLFMAGFPDDLVQRETKYRNLDLLQKYYRTDEDAEREELFLPYSTKSDTQASPSTHQLTGKTCSTKSKGKKQPNSTSKPYNTQKPSSFQQPNHLSSEPPHQFGLMGYTAIHTHAMAAFQSVQPKTPLDASPISNTLISNSGTANSASYRTQTPYQMLPPHPANAFMPLMYWPPPNTYPHGPYTSTYGGYRSFPSTGNYISIHPPQPFYSSHPSPYSSPFVPKMTQGGVQNGMALTEEASTDTDSSSSTTEAKAD